MIDIEMRGAAARNIRQEEAGHWAQIRVAILFLIVVLGILASWVWEVLWQYVKDPTKPLSISLGVLLARLILAFIAGGVTFSQIYAMINKPSSENWAPYITAFQNGFLWDSIFKTITASSGV